VLFGSRIEFRVVSQAKEGQIVFGRIGWILIKMSLFALSSCSNPGKLKTSAPPANGNEDTRLDLRWRSLPCHSIAGNKVTFPFPLVKDDRMLLDIEK
jgi:hypothetical protein